MLITSNMSFAFEFKEVLKNIKPTEEPRGQTPVSIAQGSYNATFVNSIFKKQRSVFSASSIKNTLKIAMVPKYTEEEKATFPSTIKRGLVTTYKTLETGDVETQVYAHCPERTAELEVDEKRNKRFLFVPLSFVKMFQRFSNQKLADQIYQVVTDAKENKATDFDISTVKALQEEQKLFKQEMEKYQSVLEKMDSDVFLDDGKYDFVSTVATLSQEIANDYTGIKARINNLSRKLNIGVEKDLISNPQELIFFMDGLMRDFENDNPITKLMNLMSIPQYTPVIGEEIRRLNRELMRKLTHISYAALKIEQMRHERQWKVKGETKQKLIDIIDLSAAILSGLGATIMNLYDQSFLNTLIMEPSQYVNTCLYAGVGIIIFGGSYWGQLIGSTIVRNLIPSARTLIISAGLTLGSTWYTVTSFMSFTSYVGSYLPTSVVSWITPDLASLQSAIVASLFPASTVSGTLYAVGATAFTALTYLTQAAMSITIPGSTISGNTFSQGMFNFTILFVGMKAALSLFTYNYKPSFIESDVSRSSYVIKSKPVIAIYNFITSDNMKKILSLKFITMMSAAYSKFLHGTDLSQISRVFKNDKVPYIDVGTMSYQLFMFETYNIFSYVVTNNMLRPFFEKLIRSNKTMMNVLYTRTESGINYKDILKMSGINLLLFLGGEQTAVETVSLQARTLITWPVDGASAALGRALSGSRDTTSYQLLSIMGRSLATGISDVAQDLTRIYMQWCILNRGNTAREKIFADLAASEEARRKFSPAVADFAIMPLYIQTLTTYLNQIMFNPFSSFREMKDLALLAAVNYVSKDATDEDTFTPQKLAAFVGVYVMLTAMSRFASSHETQKAMGLSSIREWEVFKNASASKPQKLSKPKSVWQRIKKNKYKIGAGLLLAAGAGVTGYLSIEQATNQLATQQFIEQDIGLTFYKQNENVLGPLKQNIYNATVESEILHMAVSDVENFELLQDSTNTTVFNATILKQTEQEVVGGEAQVARVWSEGFYRRTFEESQNMTLQLLTDVNKTAEAKAIELYNSYQPFLTNYNGLPDPKTVDDLRKKIVELRATGTWDSMQYDKRLETIFSFNGDGGDFIKTYRYAGFVKPPIVLTPPSIEYQTRQYEAFKVTKDVNQIPADEFLIAYVQKTAFMMCYEELDSNKITDYFNTQISIVDFNNANVKDHIIKKLPGYDFAMTSVPRWRFPQLTALPYNAYKAQIPLIKEQINLGFKIINHYQTNVQLYPEMELLSESLFNPDDPLAQETWFLGDRMARIAEAQTPNDYNVVVNIMRFFLSGRFRGLKDIITNEHFISERSFGSHQEEIAHKLETILEESIYSLSAYAGDLLFDNEISKLLNPSFMTSLSENSDLKKFHRALFTLAMINDYPVMSRLYYNEPLFFGINAGFKEMEMQMRSLNPDTLFAMSNRLFNQQTYGQNDSNQLKSLYPFVNSVHRDKREYLKVVNLEQQADYNKRVIDLLNQEETIIHLALSVNTKTSQAKALVPVDQFVKDYDVTIDAENTGLVALMESNIKNFDAHKLAVAVVEGDYALVEQTAAMLIRYKNNLIAFRRPYVQKHIEDENELKIYYDFYEKANRTAVSRIGGQRLDESVYNVGYNRQKKLKDEEERLRQQQEQLQQEFKELQEANRIAYEAEQERIKQEAERIKRLNEQLANELNAALNNLDIKKEYMNELQTYNKNVEGMKTAWVDVEKRLEDDYTEQSALITNIIEKLNNPNTEHISQEDIDILSDLIEKRAVLRQQYEKSFSKHLSEDEEIDNTLPATLEAIKKDNVFEKKIAEWRTTIENLIDQAEIVKLTEKIEEAEIKLAKNADQVKTFEDGLTSRVRHRENEKALFTAKKQSRDQGYINDNELLGKLIEKRQKLVVAAQEKELELQKKRDLDALVEKEQKAIAAEKWKNLSYAQQAWITIFGEPEEITEKQSVTRTGASNTTLDSEKIRQSQPVNINNYFWGALAGAAGIGGALLIRGAFKGSKPAAKSELTGKQTTEARLTKITLIRPLRDKKRTDFSNGHYSWSATRSWIVSALKIFHRERLENRPFADFLAAERRSKYQTGDPLLLYYLYYNVRWLGYNQVDGDGNLLDADTCDALQLLLKSVFRHHKQNVLEDDKLRNTSQMLLGNLDFARQIYVDMDENFGEICLLNIFETNWMVPLVSFYDAYLNNRSKVLLLNDKIFLHKESVVIPESDLASLRTYNIGNIEVLVNYENYNDYLTLKFILEEGSKLSSYLINNGTMVVTAQITEMITAK